MTPIRRVALALSVLAPLTAGCAHHSDGSHPPAVASSAPTPPPPAPAWPDAAEVPAAPAPDAPSPAPDAGPTAKFSTREELPDVHFATARVEVDRSDRQTLAAAAAWLKAHPEQIVILEGYTDVAGPRAANLALAQRRAKWVLDYLVARGVAAGRITVVARGESGTLCVDRSATCQGQNRRVHFLVRDTGSVQVTASPTR